MKSERNPGVVRNTGKDRREGPAARETKPAHEGQRNGQFRTPLTQNPHAVRDTREKVLEVAIGREVRAFRKKLGITVADLAVATDISLGMLSKIENGITSPSLTTLQALSRALGVPVTAFFRRFEEERSAVFVKAGEGSTSSAAARAPATSTICSAISARTPAASWSSPI